MHYADWKPAITASIVWIFSPGHAGFLGNKKDDVLWRWETQHASWVSQATCQPDADGDSQHPHPKMDTTAKMGVFMDDL